MTQPQAQSQPAPRLADTLVVVAYMTVVQAHSSMAALWLPAIAPKVAAAVGLPAAMIGYQVLLMYLGAMTTSLFVGGMIARFGAWRTCQASMFMFAAAHLLLMTGRPAVMALGSVVLGLGYGMVNPPGAHLLAKVVTPRNRNLVFSVRFTGVPLGGILASLLAPRRMGHARAFEMLALGEPFSAERAREAGLVNAVVACDALMATAHDAGLRLAAKPPAALKIARDLMRGASIDEITTRLEDESRLFAQRMTSPEAREAFQAFVEKRKPDFSKV